MRKILLITLIGISSSLLADADLYDRISLAITSSDVVLTKSLVRQLDDLGITEQEKKDALHRFTSQASTVVNEQSGFRVFRNVRDSYNMLIPSGMLGLNLWELLSESLSKSWTHKLKDFVSIGTLAAYYHYQLKKGWGCYHQRKQYDRALRIETWLKAQEGTD